MRKVALIDLDGTVADYDTAMLRDLEKLRNPAFERPVKEIYRKEREDWLKERIELIRNQPGWWRDLKPLESGLIIIDEMRKLNFDLIVLTRAPKRAKYSWAEKPAWVEKYIPDALPIVTRANKGITEGDVLFDDYPEYMEDWLNQQKNGLGIMNAAEYNIDFNHPRCIKFDGTNLELIIHALNDVVRDR